MSDTTRKWIMAAANRAIRTFAQAALSMLTVGQAVMDVNWLNVVSVSFTAAVISILTSLAAGLPELSTEDTKEESKDENTTEE
jgi:hypothetical protein